MHHLRRELGKLPDSIVKDKTKENKYIYIYEYSRYNCWVAFKLE
jgi:hypothetical protein